MREKSCDLHLAHSSFKAVNAATESLSSFRSAPNPSAAPLGAHPVAGGTQFRLYAQTDQPVQVRIVDARGTPLQTHALTPAGDGCYEATVAGAGHGTLYQFLLGDRELPDP